MLPTDCSLFSLREPLRMEVSHICRRQLLVCIWTAQRGSHSKIREKRRTACLDLQQWHTTCIADILKPETP